MDGFEISIGTALKLLKNKAKFHNITLIVICVQRIGVLQGNWACLSIFRNNVAGLTELIELATFLV